MRKDMEKVISEKPRYGAKIKTPKGEKRKLQICWDELPKTETMCSRWNNWEQGTSYVFGVIWKYLRSKVGEKWDDIYSEICNNLQNHRIKDIILMQVEREIVVIDGVCCWSRTNHPISDGFYVNPETGLLEEAPPRKRYHRAKYPKAIWGKDKNKKPIQYHKINGIWYEVQIKTYVGRPYLIQGNLFFDGKFPFYDTVLLKTFTNKYSMEYIYDGKYMGISKRQLNSKELKKLNLRNN